MTYIRRNYGEWELHNDLQQKIKRIKNIKKIKVKPHAIIVTYIYRYSVFHSNNNTKYFRPVTLD